MTVFCRSLNPSLPLVSSYESQLACDGDDMGAAKNCFLAFRTGILTTCALCSSSMLAIKSCKFGQADSIEQQTISPHSFLRPFSPVCVPPLPFPLCLRYLLTLPSSNPTPNRVISFTAPAFSVCQPRLLAIFSCLFALPLSTLSLIDILVTRAVLAVTSSEAPFMIPHAIQQKHLIDTILPWGKF